MPNYRHLAQMTDDIGMLQFSRGSCPDPSSGYTLDDNARALLAALFMGKSGYDQARLYTSFLSRAQRRGKWFNYFSGIRYSSRFDSEDSIGRAVMACSFGASSQWPDIREDCTRMLQKILPRVVAFTSPRAIAYVLIGLCKGVTPCPSHQLKEMIDLMAEELVNLYRAKRKRNWLWFEDYLTYCNGILPQALFSVYACNGNSRFLKTAHESLQFLNQVLFARGYLNIVGNRGWYNRGGLVPLFDQQPVDAASICFACREAYHITGKSDYSYLAGLAYDWYHGQNIHGLSLYDPQSGGCYDALTEDGVNLNQGAEAVLSLLLTEQLMESESTFLTSSVIRREA